MAAALALAFGLACSDATPVARGVVFVVVDTLRADHVGCYGYERATTPRVDAFAGVATRFERALASAGWTVPSHASLFTGLDPFEHGATSIELRPGARMPRNVHPLAPEFTTIAEAFAERGFATAAFVANAGFLHPSLGLDQGFAIYHAAHEPGDLLNQRIFRWLEDLGDEPFFLFVNYMDAHRPYNTRPRPGLLERAVDPDPGLLDQLRREVGTRRTVPPDLVARVIDQYDTGVAHADEAIGELLDKLRALGRFESSVVVVTSDHGEFFGEHRLVEHSKGVYQEALRVPLLLKVPEQSSSRLRRDLVTSADVPHLVMSALGPRADPGLTSQFTRSPGSLPPLAEHYWGRSRDQRNPALAARVRRIRRALFAWPHKRIHSSDGSHELYDIDADPREQRNLSAERPELARALDAALAGRLASGRAPARATPATSTERDLEELRALGYVE